MIYITLLQYDQNGANSKKLNVIFFFFTKCKYAHIYWINKSNELTAEMFVVLPFAKVPPIKYVCWKKQIFFWFRVPLVRTLKKKKKKKWRHWNNRLPFWPDLPLSLPLTRVRTFLMESHLRMSTVLFVLLYKSYTGRVKS